MAIVNKIDSSFGDALLDWSWQQDLPSLDPSNSSGGFGQLNVVVDKSRTPDWLNLFGKPLVLSHAEYGKMGGKISGVSLNNNTVLNVAADGPLAAYNIVKTVRNFNNPNADQITVRVWLETLARLIGQNPNFIITDESDALYNNYSFPSIVDDNWWDNIRAFMQAKSIEIISATRVVQGVEIYPLIVRTPRKNSISISNAIISSTDTYDAPQRAHNVRMHYYNYEPLSGRTEPEYALYDSLLTDSLLEEGWYYWGAEPPPSNWKDPSFDPSIEDGWTLLTQGPRSGVVSGSPPVNQTLVTTASPRPATVYFRYSLDYGLNRIFTDPDATFNYGIELNDGVKAYLNNVFMGAWNTTSTASHTAFATANVANATSAAAFTDGTTPATGYITQSVINPNGRNALCFEVKAYNTTSDIAFQWQAYLTGWPRMPVATAQVYPTYSDPFPNEFSVDAGKIVEQTVQSDAYLYSLVTPINCVDSVENKRYDAKSVYSVTGADYLPVTAAQWKAAGGSITATIDPVDPTKINLKIKGANIPSLAPFHISMSSGNNYNSLHIAGKGLSFLDRTIDLKTGYPQISSADDVGTEVSNIYVDTVGEATNVGAATVAAYGGPVRTLQVDTSLSALDSNVDNLPGARIRKEQAIFRVESVTINHTNATLSARQDTTWNDLGQEWGTQTLFGFQSYWGSTTYENFSLQSLETDGLN